VTGNFCTCCHFSRYCRSTVWRAVGHWPKLHNLWAHKLKCP